jgi:hypothetical protein
VTILSRSTGDITHHLSDALVIEPNRDTPRLQEDCHAVTDDYRSGMIDFKTMTTHKFHGEWLERRALL